MEDLETYEGERPVLGDPVRILWNGDGSYTPVCEVCGFVGKDQTSHSAARAIARNHATAKSHRAKVSR